ncbi:MAG: geranylgeranyl diphosphate synthase, type [Actinomycetota bacterium]
MTLTESSFETMFASYAAITSEAVATHLPSAGGAGSLGDMMRDYPRRGGKAIRPALCLATCEAFGGELRDALPSAVAMELLHNAFLVHDDVEDGSLLRRGRPTLHARWDVPSAINAGDGLALLGQKALRANRDHLGGRMADLIAQEFEEMARHTVEGQAVELAWRRDGVFDLTPEDYLDLILRKTCWYTTIHPLRVGALIGGWGTVDPDPLARFGFYLGAAFQIQDDMLNLTGEVERYGKERDGDLYEGKRTLLLIHLLANAAPDERRWLEAFLRAERTDRTPDDVDKVRRLLDEYGSLEFTRRFGEGIAEAATAAFQVAFADAPDSPARRFVAELIPYMLERSE